MGMGDLPPHQHLLAKGLVSMVSYKHQWGGKHWMSYLSYFLHIFFLIHTESLYCHPFGVIGAFPNIAETSRGDGMFSCFDKLSGNDVGGW